MSAQAMALPTPALPPAEMMSAPELLRRLAHLAPDEVGAVFLLLLHQQQAGGEPLPDEAGLAQLTRLGANWFRRVPGSAQTRGQRILAALPEGSLRVAAAPAAPTEAISAAQRAQRQAAAHRRWEVLRGAGQLDLPLAAPGGGGAAEVKPPGPVAVAARPGAPPGPPDVRPPVARPDEAEIPEAEAIDFVRGWLVQWTGWERAFPDDQTCRNVLAAAPGRSLMEIYQVLSAKFSAKVPAGRGWGWFVAVVRNHFAAAAGGGGYGAAAAVAG